MSFKYPEQFSQIPPAEITRIRSKSQHSVYDSAGTGTTTGSNIEVKDQIIYNVSKDENS